MLISCKGAKPGAGLPWVVRQLSGACLLVTEVRRVEEGRLLGGLHKEAEGSYTCSSALISPLILNKDTKYEANGPCIWKANLTCRATYWQSCPGRKLVIEALTRRVLLEDSPGEPRARATALSLWGRGMAMAWRKSEAKAGLPGETNGCPQGILLKSPNWTLRENENMSESIMASDIFGAGKKIQAMNAGPRIAVIAH